MKNPSNILLTFARSPLTLELARQLHSAGHRIVVADSIKPHISHFSNAVSKSITVPKPLTQSREYLNTLVKITQEESIDLIVPMFEETAYISQHKELFPKQCNIFSPSFQLFRDLHHKWLFQCKLKELGLEAVPSILIRNQKELESLSIKKSVILKACYSRASQRIHKLNPGEPIPNIEIDADNPMIAQEWLDGDKFCSYSICHQGTLFAHALYPVQYAIGGNSCVMFESINHPEILQWITTFVQKTSYTGQIAFDFILTKNKRLYAIECNPRATSGLHLFSETDRLHEAFFAINTTPIFPKEGIKKQLAMGMLLYGWKKSSLPNNRFSNFLKDFTTIPDVVYHPRDRKPFLLKPFVFGLLLKEALKSKLSLPEYFIHDHHWNGI